MVAFTDRPTLDWVTMTAVRTAHSTRGTLSDCPIARVSTTATVTRTVRRSSALCSRRSVRSRVQAVAIGLMLGSPCDAIEGAESRRDEQVGRLVESWMNHGWQQH